MQSSDNYKPSLSFGLLLKGQPKVGKTTLALQFPDPWIAVCDENFAGPLRHIRQNFPQKKVHFDTINYVRQPDGTHKSVPEDERWDRLVTCTNEAILSPLTKTIIWDNLLSISTYLTDKIIATKPSGKDKDKMTIGDWIPFRNMISKAVTLYRSCGKYFIVTCHEMANKNELTGEIRWQPHMPSNLSENFGGFFSDEWLCGCDLQGTDDSGNAKISRWVRTVGDASRSMGSSLQLPPTFEFTWEGLEKRLRAFDEVMSKKA